ncbi:hypothetical protein T484DRAFT_1859033 [Baffinella frigidus]|nr:hypothetical protein T484DRAFT_1859033 [Cryptophyta sp. CCMP2293]
MGADSTAVTACAAALVEELKVERSVALRFARARQGDFSKAKPFLQKDLEWREKMHPELVKQADFPTALASGCWRMLGCTPAGLPVVIIQLGLWDPGKYDVDEYERSIIYFLEKIMGRGRGEKFVVMFDMHGWKLSHVMYMRNIARLLSTLQAWPCTLNPRP